MLKSIFILAVFLLQFFTCDKNGLETITHEANLVNNIAVDGCEWHLNVHLKDETLQYAFSENSRSKVEAVINASQATQGIFSIKVDMTYSLTGNKKDVQCGWGKKQSFDEIEISSILKK